MRKKKGSTLLLLLVMGMIIAILGATLAGAVSYTTKSNIRDKDIEDLIYAAESGIDYAYSKLKTEDITGQTVKNSDLNGNGVALTACLFNKVNELTVVIGVEDAAGNIKIISTAKDSNGKTKRVTAKVKRLKPVTGEVFNNSLVAAKDNVGISGSGTVNLQTTNVNSNTPKNVSITGEFKDAEKTTANAYEDLKFVSTFAKSNKVTVNQVAGLGTQFKDEAGNNIAPINLTPYATGASAIVPNVKGVGYINYDFGYKVYIVNANELNISFATGTESINKNMIVCGGKVNLVPTVAGGSFTLHGVNSTIFGQGIGIAQNGSLTMSYMPVRSATDTYWNGHELTAAQLTTVNDDLKLFISNWITGAGGGGGAGGTGYTLVKDDYTIE